MALPRDPIQPDRIARDVCNLPQWEESLMLLLEQLRDENTGWSVLASEWIVRLFTAVMHLLVRRYSRTSRRYRQGTARGDRWPPARASSRVGDRERRLGACLHAGDSVAGVSGRRLALT